MKHSWYRLPQAAHDAVAEDGKARRVKATAQSEDVLPDTEHVLFLKDGIVHSCLLSEWRGEAPERWEA